MLRGAEATPLTADVTHDSPLTHEHLDQGLRVQVLKAQAQVLEGEPRIALETATAALQWVSREGERTLAELGPAGSLWVFCDCFSLIVSLFYRRYAPIAGALH